MCQKYIGLPHKIFLFLGKCAVQLKKAFRWLMANTVAFRLGFYSYKTY